MTTHIQFRLRIRRDDEIAIGPGKIQLLEAIERTGSISAAGRALDMYYRRAWLLVDELNRSLREPAVQAPSFAGPLLKHLRCAVDVLRGAHHQLMSSFLQVPQGIPADVRPGPARRVPGAG